MHKFLRCDDGGVSGRRGWHGKIVGKELYGPCDVFLAISRHKNTVATVVLQRRADVPDVDAVRRPGAALLRCFMQENFGARGRERCFIVVKGSIEKRFGQEL